MNYHQLRQKYPQFIYDSYSHRLKDRRLLCEFKYSIPPNHSFAHQVVFENCELKIVNLENLVFHVGLAEMFSYWKLTSSPVIEIAAGHLSPDQIKFWHKLFIKGMGQYFYENHVDFTKPEFLKIKAREGVVDLRAQRTSEASSRARKDITPRAHVLVPLGGGKDSIVTAELLKKHFPIRPIIVHPTTPASLRVSQLLGHPHPIIVRRTLDPLMLQLTRDGYLTGHIPYSAVLAFIFLPAAAIENIPYIAVSNERSSDEGNLEYLGHIINHQYTKTLEFEADFNKYLKSLTTYFSFLRPLHELQIAQIFARYPQFFPIFRSCNRGQQTDSWCGRCPKCLSIALSLIPWIGEAKVVEILGANPLTDPVNHKLLAQMTNPAQVKPFECIVSTEEAQICLEFIRQGQTPRVKEFLNRWGPSAMPPPFESILKQEYYRT